MNATPMTRKIEAADGPRNPVPTRKPRLALAIATVGGLGYLKPGPGTWGSLAGLFLVLSPWIVRTVASRISGEVLIYGTSSADPLLLCQIYMTLGIATIGVITATRAARFYEENDPQRVVIDEVSGQQLTLLLGGFWPSFAIGTMQQPRSHPLGMFQMMVSPNWKYLLLGFILFRVFDIWKPFPARQAEQLPGGWGIMADDWIAAVYAALGLWIARGLGL
jgi:phosphatidylglycerophosphatase A